MGQSHLARRVETAFHTLGITITGNVIGAICSYHQRRCTTAKWRSLDHVVERRHVRARDAQQPSSDAATSTNPRNCKVYFNNVAGRCLSAGLIARARGCSHITVHHCCGWGDSVTTMSAGVVRAKWKRRLAPDVRHATHWKISPQQLGSECRATTRVLYRVARSTTLRVVGAAAFGQHRLDV
jgi:hypothetical protein